MWICKNCGESVDEGFGTCWNCGTSQDGVAPSNLKEFENIKGEVTKNNESDHYSSSYDTTR